jgi:hypothetical protein
MHNLERERAIGALAAFIVTMPQRWNNAVMIGMPGSIERDAAFEMLKKEAIKRVTAFADALESVTLEG